MTPLPHLCAPIDLNDVEQQIPCDKTKSQLDFNEIEPVDEETTSAIAREAHEEDLCVGESERRV